MQESMKCLSSIKPFTLFLIVCISVPGFAQQPFIAGQINNTISYWNIEPDTLISIEPVTGSYSSYAEFIVDVDQDNTNDFKITVFEAVGYSFDLEASIWGYDTNEVFVGLYDTLFPAGSNPGDTLFFPVAKPFDAGDTIPDSFTGTTFPVYFCRSHASNSWFGGNLAWEDIGAHYVGFKMIKPEYEVLGWFKLSVENFQGGGNPTVMVYDYAVKLPGLNHLDKNGETKNMMTFPNPAKSLVQVTFAKQSWAQLKCFNTYGQQVHQQEIHSAQTVINVSTWSQGIYLVVLYEDEKPVERAKFVVRH